MLAHNQPARYPEHGTSLRPRRAPVAPPTPSSPTQQQHRCGASHHHLHIRSLWAALSQPSTRRRLHTTRASAAPQPPPQQQATALRAAEQGGGGLTFRPDLSRATPDPFPPLGSKATGLQRLGLGLWCLRQDLNLAQNVYLHAHLVRLSSGSWMLVNPPAPTEEAVALLKSLVVEGGEARDGQVEHVVLLNLSPEHWYHAPDWAPHLAGGVTLWVVPGLLQGRSTAATFNGPERVRQMQAVYDRVLELPDVGPLPGLEQEVEVATFHESQGFFSESTLWFRNHRAAVLADMGFAAYDHPIDGPLSLGSAQLAGIYRRLGCPVAYIMLRKDPRVARAWAERVLSWEVDKVLGSHLDPCVPDGASELRRCFGFALEL